MKVGIIYTAYNTESYIEPSLRPWLNASGAVNGVGEHEFFVCAVNMPFKNFPNEGTDDTNLILREHVLHDDIHLIDSNEPVTEVEARGLALKYLIDKDVDIVWQVDSDEFYAPDEIRRIISFVESNPLISWFRICLKNYVFNQKTYLVDPFTPPRIHRIRQLNHKADSFSDDNNVQYRHNSTGEFKSQDGFSNLTIPQSIAWVKHLTWQSDDRSRRKVEYQLKRWGDCSFAWDDKRKTLVFNESYFINRGLPFPMTTY